jgi:hypothetical protein
MKACASIVKYSGLSTSAKVGVIAAGGVIAGSTLTVVGALGSITKKKVDNANLYAELRRGNIPSSVHFGSTSEKPISVHYDSISSRTDYSSLQAQAQAQAQLQAQPQAQLQAQAQAQLQAQPLPQERDSGEFGSAFSIEPSADLDTVMSLLDANYTLHICILYLPIVLMILYQSSRIVGNKEYARNLIFIKNIFGEGFYNLLIKSLSYTGKYNIILMFIG